jgi:hypothetical protein
MKTNLLLASVAALSLLAAPALADNTAAKATVGGTGGAVAGASTGGLIFGPIGAIIGGFTGATIGANAGINSSSVDYVRTHPSDPEVIEGTIDTGYAVPKHVRIHPIDGDPDHGYFYTNDRVYIVNMSDDTVVYSPGTVVPGK